MKKCNCLEIIPKKWYRIKVSGIRGTTVAQCLSSNDKDKTISFSVGNKETKTTYGPRIMILHEDDIMSIYEVSPRYIETKTRKIKGSITEYYYDTFE